MSVTISINDKTFISDKFYEMTKYPLWDDRAAVEFTIESTYDEVKSLFVEDAVWKIIDENETEKDMSEYSVPGYIKDNRDGTITAMMGKPTELETLIETIYGGVN